MKGEIDKDYFCSRYTGGIACMERLVSFENCATCECYHRKYPTPEQYKEEYGEEWAGAVYAKCADDKCRANCHNGYEAYASDEYASVDSCNAVLIVCACTPWGNPPADWRPE